MMVACGSSRPHRPAPVGQGGGEAGGAGGHVADAGGDRPKQPTMAGSAFAAVQTIFASKCVRCHDPAHPNVPETVTVRGIAR